MQMIDIIDAGSKAAYGALQVFKKRGVWGIPGTFARNPIFSSSIISPPASTARVESAVYGATDRRKLTGNFQY